jgi:hypothetical protein
MTTENANNPTPEADATGQELANDPALDNTDDTVLDQDGDAPQPKDDDTDEIEYEGGKFRVPKVLKEAFLRQADYTRKTQEVAEARKAAEADRTAVSQQTALIAALRQDYARVDALEQALAQFEKTDWAALYSSNREQFDLLQIQERQLRAAHANASRELHTKVNKAQQDAAADHAKRRSELATSLARDIQGYSPETASRMEKFGVATYGFTADEVSRTVDPRIHRMLHDAMIGREAIAKAAKAAAASKTAEAAEAAKPTPNVGSRTPARSISSTDKASDKLTDDQWFKAERERLARKAQRAPQRA